MMTDEQDTSQPVPLEDLVLDTTTVNVEDLAWEASNLGQRFINAVRSRSLEHIEPLIAPGTSADLALRVFGEALLHLNMHLDDPKENGRLAPYSMQLDGNVAILELGVILDEEPNEAGEQGHRKRLFGSALILDYSPDAPDHWLVNEVIAVNIDGYLRSDDPTDEMILKTYQGYFPLPLRYERLDDVETLFLEQMQSFPGRFNVEEQLNAVRLWHDFLTDDIRALNLMEYYYATNLGVMEPDPLKPNPDAEWAAAVEYLIILFDYHEVDVDEIAARYLVPPDSITDHAREISSTLQVTQFDDRYSMHPEPLEHYRQVFGELGIDPARDEKARQKAAQNNIFDTIEVMPDDETFYGPS